MSARHKARKERCAKTDPMLAATMASWYRVQRQVIARPDFTFRPPVSLALPATTTPEATEARIVASAEELRTLHESGEIAWTGLSLFAAYQMVFLDDDPND